MKTKIFNLLLIIAIAFSSLEIFAKDKDVKIEIMYFHATIRCAGCLKIESNIKTAVDLLFSKEIKSKKISLKSIDFLQTENEHFQDDYKFDSQTLIISKKVNGKEVKWVKLDKIWDYSDDLSKFKIYLDDEVKKLLKD